MRIVDSDDLVVGFTHDEFVQALVDIAVKKGLIPEARRLDPAFHEFIRGDEETPLHLTVLATGTQVGRRVLTQREEPK